MSKRCGMLVALAIAAAFIAGCDSSSSPSNPVDTVAPAAVLDVQAHYDGNLMQVTWAAGSEADLAGYRVYRSTNGAAAILAGYETSTTYVDTSVGARASYRYEVTAVDQSGNESPRASTTQVFVSTTAPARGRVTPD